MKIISVVGARPNFMKIAPFIKEIELYNKLISNPQINHILVHTGQHYDDRMSKAFFDDLGIPQAEINLGIGSGSHAEQVGNTMIAFEKILLNENPDWIIVLGDVNATLACSVTAKKLHIKVCHIEAGLRSGDERMPEEINRLVTDRLSDLLLTPDLLSSQNLRKEGITDEKIKFVGNIMIDTLQNNLELVSDFHLDKIIEKNFIDNQNLIPNKIKNNNFGLITMHRPSNVDDKEVLEPIIRFLLEDVVKDMYLIWAIHPRTQKQLVKFNLWEDVLKNDNLFLLHPIGYQEMLKLNSNARVMLTDSGGLQEECTVLGTPCLTLRWNTERPITLKENGGASVLVGNNIVRIKKEYKKILVQQRVPIIPDLWDGKTAKRCLEAILNYENKV